jgi:hypothetical protein
MLMAWSSSSFLIFFFFSIRRAAAFRISSSCDPDDGVECACYILLACWTSAATHTRPTHTTSTLFRQNLAKERKGTDPRLRLAYRIAEHQLPLLYMYFFSFFLHKDFPVSFSLAAI